MTAKKTNTKSVANRRTNLKKTKKNLKQLSSSGGKHALRSSIRIVKYGAKSFTRNLWLSAAATLVMTFTLVILFVTIVASVVLSNTANTLRDKIDITLFFYPGTSAETLNSLKEVLQADPNVKSATPSTTEDEYQLTLKENQDNQDLIAVLTDETMDMKELMLKVTQAAIRVKVYNPGDLSSIKNLVENHELFVANIDPEKESNYEVNRTEIETINTWAKIAKNGGIILGAIFLVVSVLIIFNTVRMSIFSRREEIYMMKLVGANKSFIRGPFLVEAQISGIIAGVIAATISFFGFKFFAPKLTAYGIDTSFITDILDSNKLVFVFLGMILIGAGIGSISALLASKRYLKKTK